MSMHMKEEKTSHELSHKVKSQVTKVKSSRFQVVKFLIQVIILERSDSEV